MVIGQTVEGFDVAPGDAVWVPKLISTKGITLRKPAPTEEDPHAFVDTPFPVKTYFTPVQITPTDRLVDSVWKRHGECFTHCIGLNRSRSHE